MNKKIWMIILIGIVLLAGIGFYLYFNNNNSQDGDGYVAKKTSSEGEQTEQAEQPENPKQTQNQTEQATENQVSPTPEITEERQGITESNPTPPPAPIEEQIATFTTKIYSKDSARQNNISITCNTLNGFIVKNGETFSFCNTVGQASSSKGYQKADIFDKNGNKKKGLGGRKLSNQLYFI